MFGKRGLSKLGIAIIVILVVLVAAVLIYNLSVKEEAKPDTLSEQCNFACESQQKVAFCDVERLIGENTRATCNELATNSQYSQYGVQTCPAISCVTQGTGGTQAPDQTCTGLGAVWTTPTASGTCPIQEGKFVRKRTPSDSPPAEGQICCFYYT